MNKNELIAAVAENAGISKKDAKAAVDATFEAISAAMAKGDKLQLVGFGTFETAKRAARSARNPRTNETIEIPAANVPKFKASKALKDRVNA